MKIDFSPLNELQINPKTENYFTNEKGQKLHCRFCIPDKCKLMIIQFHGIKTHINQNQMMEYGKQLNQENIGIAMYDIISHGYSDQIDGIPQQLQDAESLIQDSIQFINICIGNITCDTININFSNLPFQLQGLSLGGAIATITAHRLNMDKQKYPNFQGTLLIAPLLEKKLPNCVILSILKALARIMPKSYLPSSFNETLKPEDLVGIENVGFIEKYRRESPFHIDEGLRFATALCALNLMRMVQEVQKGVDYPILLQHDPNDKITSFNGTQVVQDHAVTQDKKLIRLDGSHHFVLATSFAIFVNNSIDFIKRKNY